jgi:ribonucleotide reductase alpha subunit
VQFDAWGVTPSPRWDWAALKERLRAHGLRNSLLVAPMPTASTAQILGNNECFEPYTSNLYVRRTLAGEFFVLNPHLQRELQRLGLWDRAMRDRIIAAGGSVQGLSALPQRVRDVYKTAWEMKQRTLIDMAAERGAYIDQSQSLNLFLKDPPACGKGRPPCLRTAPRQPPWKARPAPASRGAPPEQLGSLRWPQRFAAGRPKVEDSPPFRHQEPTFAQLSSMHFHSWRRGLKTGMYYLRTQPAADAIKFTLGSEPSSEGAERSAGASCSFGSGGSDCEACSA